jgi:ATP-dependent DNA helicase RecG
VQTRLVPAEKRAAMHAFVRDEIGKGAQAYVVLPVIESSPAHELRDATAEFERLKNGPFQGLQLGLLHGRLPAAEKLGLWTGFQAGRVQVLVCTSLVEVGLDVARATLMLVHHPERFGLASLHQLRGRVGRGSGASWCFLLPGAETSEAAMARLQRFASIDDGFRIAELDLEQRGMGDLVGTRQHGEQELRIADLGRDTLLLERAHADAFEIVRRDPKLERPEHAAARAHLEARFATRGENAAVG